MNNELFSFIKSSPTAFQAVDTIGRMLREAGYTELSESEGWELRENGRYFVTRNGSSVIAFRVPEGGVRSFMITAAHCDSPCFKLRDRAELKSGEFIRLSVEGYGGMLFSTWQDRPLSVAGRVLVRTATGVKSVLVDFGEPVCLMPNVAIHMNRNANKEPNLNPAVDLQPLYSGKGGADTFRKRLAEKAGVGENDILSTDLFVYNPQPGVEWGDFISAPRLDDLQCAFASVKAFIASETGAAVPVCAVFDNEEVGSHTKQGAASTFLKDTLSRIGESFGVTGSELARAVASSFMLSCDNAHSVHPNHPEYADKNNAPVMNGGIVVKFNAAQRYTSDAVSAAIFELICREAGAPVQIYVNRPDIPGGGTLGNISNAQVSLNAVDIGLAQLAMHSAYETAGALDTEHMVNALRVFYAKRLIPKGSGEYTLE